MFVLSSTSIGILILHAAIMCIQFIVMRVFPSQRFTALGIYFILLPVGFGFFSYPGPWMTLGSVLLGLGYILFMANRSAVNCVRESSESGV